MHTQKPGPVLALQEHSGKQKSAPGGSHACPAGAAEKLRRPCQLATGSKPAVRVRLQCGHLCAAAYYTIIPELEFRVRLFFFFFGSLHWLSVLLPTITTHRMKAAVIELRSAVQGVSMANYSDDLLAQLRMMLNSMKHDDLRFTGCGFFVVDLSTFADIMGAVITYTVVLVQTNESYLRGSLEHCTNHSAA
nr:uncharacterized protein LOC119163948 [Rhipicephalus microplus]